MAYVRSLVNIRILHISNLPSRIPFSSQMEIESKRRKLLDSIRRRAGRKNYLELNCHRIYEKVSKSVNTFMTSFIEMKCI